MPLYSQMSATFEGSQEALDRTMKINAVILRNAQGSRRRPQPPRSLIAQAGTLQALITWNAPPKARGIIGFRIYKDTETNVVEEIRDPNRRQTYVKLPGNTTTAAFYISTITAAGAESPKVQVLATSNADPGSAPGAPPGWPSEPSGGNPPKFWNQL